MKEESGPGAVFPWCDLTSSEYYCFILKTCFKKKQDKLESDHVKGVYKPGLSN